MRLALRRVAPLPSHYEPPTREQPSRLAETAALAPRPLTFRVPFTPSIFARPLRAVLLPHQMRDADLFQALHRAQQGDGHHTG